MPDAAMLLILGMLALTGLVGLVDVGEADEDDPDRERPDETEEENSQTFLLELTLEDQDIELIDFDPSQDKLIIVSPSSDVSLDIESDSAASTLVIGYGDSETTVAGAWPEGNLGDSVIFRHINDDGHTYQDYQVTFHESGDASIGPNPELSIIGTGSSSITTDTTDGIIRFSDQTPDVQIEGSGHEAQEDIELNEEIAQFETEPDFLVFGSTGEGYYVLANGSYSFIGRDSDDQIVVDDAKAVIQAGSGNDKVTVVDRTGDQSQVIAYGGAGEDSISGSEASDYFDGGRDADIIYGNGDDDYIIGGAGVDKVLGGSGNDIIFGASGDLVETESGAVGWEAYADGVEDTLYGGSGADEIYADQWDTAYGGEGVDSIKIAYQSTSLGTTFVADFDPENDEIEVVLSADDPIAQKMGLGPGTYSAEFLSWEEAEQGSSVYVLKFGSISLAEVSSPHLPTLDNVRLSVVPVI